ncbi:hypothetical protein LCGC14_0590210 [marine sediment metagenome]|uniref:Uncharacterized protein n=1 Tax=marine sediment metagenome TaxID=412755 RepID=A0A0F9UM51_9ZZZZ
MKKRFLGLAAMLLVASFLFSQGTAATSFEVEPMAETCVLLLDGPAMSDCAMLQVQGSCSGTCLSSYVTRSVIPDLPLLSLSPYPKAYSSHSGRVLSGPDPFPPKYSSTF